MSEISKIIVRKPFDEPFAFTFTQLPMLFEKNMDMFVLKDGVYELKNDLPLPAESDKMFVRDFYGKPFTFILSQLPTLFEKNLSSFVLKNKVYELDTNPFRCDDKKEDKIIIRKRKLFEDKIVVRKLFGEPFMFTPTMMPMYQWQ